MVPAQWHRPPRSRPGGRLPPGRGATSPLCSCLRAVLGVLARAWPPPHPSDISGSSPRPCPPRSTAGPPRPCLLAVWPVPHGPCLLPGSQASGWGGGMRGTATHGRLPHLRTEWLAGRLGAVGGSGMSRQTPGALLPSPPWNPGLARVPVPTPCRMDSCEGWWALAWPHRGLHPHHLVGSTRSLRSGRSWLVLREAQEAGRGDPRSWVCLTCVPGPEGASPSFLPREAWPRCLGLVGVHPLIAPFSAGSPRAW